MVRGGSMNLIFMEVLPDDVTVRLGALTSEPVIPKFKYRDGDVVPFTDGERYVVKGRSDNPETHDITYFVAKE